MSLPYPTEIIKATQKEPAAIVIAAKNMIGKSTICASLPDHFFISFQKAGMATLDHKGMYFDSVTESFRILDMMKENGDLPKYLIVDHLSALRDKAWVQATLDYQSSSIGKNWNRAVPRDYTSHQYMPHEPEFSIIQLEAGGHYNYHRKAMVEWIRKYSSYCPHTIFVGHIKQSEINVETKSITQSSVDLPGKLVGIVASEVDGIAYMSTGGIKSPNSRILNFSTLTGEGMGTRFPYLVKQGKIVISDFDPDTEKVTTYWEKIFPSLKK